MKEEKRDIDADKTVKMIVPDVQREGSKKIRICNLSAICKRLQRNIEHVKEFIYAELSTSGSVDGKEQLILKGKFGQKQIEIVLKKYIYEYASCWGCHSIDTNLVKENRMSFVSCNGCQSKRCVTAIKSGFKAQVTKRKLLAK